MKTHRLSGTLCFVVVCLFLSPPVHAGKLWIHSLEPISDPITVDSFGSTTLKNVFSLEERPFAFIEFEKDSLNTSAPLLINWFWTSVDHMSLSFEHEAVVNFSSDPVQIWNGIDHWDLIKRPGEWTVKTSWFNPQSLTKGGLGSAITPFTVTPEPASTILFLVGAVPIAGALLRRRKPFHSQPY